MIAILFPLAFIPSIIAFIWIRDTERYNKESWVVILFTFIWGATLAAGMALLTETMIGLHIANFFLLSVVFAPIIEESFKPLVLRILKHKIDEIEDGLIYGAVAGLGFAATENLIWGTRFWNEGFLVILCLFYLRTVSTSLMHASATALTGYGYSNLLIRKRPILSILPYYLLAIAAHGIFNLFAYSALFIHRISGVVMAAVFAVALLLFIRKKIQLLDKKETTIKDTLSVKPH